MKKSPLNMVGVKSPLNLIEDKSHTHASKNNSVGIVGESQIWDGPLDQEGRQHVPGASNSGPRAMKLKLDVVPYKGGPITQIAKGN